MNDKVVAVVVTFNRKNYLIECIRALKSQTYKIAEIIIVDNASTDGTQKIIEESGLLQDGCCRYVLLDKNTGGSGGFNIGLNLAMQTDASWFWVMDDDVAPELNCLEEMITYKNVSECIHPRKVLIDGKDYMWEHHIDILTGGRTLINNKSFENGKDIVFTNVACFEGMLVSRRVVERVGLPDPKYFISEDDTLFGVKASIYTNVSYVSKALMHKLIPISVTTPWKTYYVIRNRFYFYRDACEYMDLRPSFSSRVLFVFAQLLELIRTFKRGRLFFLPAIKGFFVGLSYMCKKR